MRVGIYHRKRLSRTGQQSTSNSRARINSTTSVREHISTKPRVSHNQVPLKLSGRVELPRLRHSRGFKRSILDVANSTSRYLSKSLQSVSCYIKKHEAVPFTFPWDFSAPYRQKSQEITSVPSAELTQLESSEAISKVQNEVADEMEFLDCWFQGDAVCTQMHHSDEEDLNCSLSKRAPGKSCHFTTKDLISAFSKRFSHLATDFATFMQECEREKYEQIQDLEIAVDEEQVLKGFTVKEEILFSQHSGATPKQVVAINLDPTQTPRNTLIDLEDDCEEFILPNAGQKTTKMPVPKSNMNERARPESTEQSVSEFLHPSVRNSQSKRTFTPTPVKVDPLYQCPIPLKILDFVFTFEVIGGNITRSKQKRNLKDYLWSDTNYKADYYGQFWGKDRSEVRNNGLSKHTMDKRQLEIKAEPESGLMIDSSKWDPRVGEVIRRTFVQADSALVDKLIKAGTPPSN